MRPLWPCLVFVVLTSGACRVRDGRIEEEVARRLDAEHVNVHASVERQIVTLRGFVPSERERRRADELARSVPGVLSVRDELLLQQPPSLTAASPDAIASASIASDLAAAGLRGVTVEVVGGVVHLRGTATPEERAAATRIASAYAPRDHIADETTLAPDPPPPARRR